MAENEKQVTGAVELLGKDSVWVKIAEQPKGSTVTIKYNTLNGNEPNYSGNYIGLWETNKGEIPEDKKAKEAYLMRNDETSSDTYSQSFKLLNDNEHILGYCQTGDPSVSLEAAQNVSALAVINPTAKAQETVQSCMDLEITGDSTEVIVRYKILKNMERSSHWFGIWGINDSIKKDRPLYVKKVHDIDREKKGEFRIKGSEVVLSRGGKYKLAYFANAADAPSSSERVKNMVSIYEFQV